MCLFFPNHSTTPLPPCQIYKALPAQSEAYCRTVQICNIVFDAHWSHINCYFTFCRHNLINVLLLVDASVPTQNIDLGCARWLFEHEIPFSLIFTKIDKRKKKCPSPQENILNFEVISTISRILPNHGIQILDGIIARRQGLVSGSSSQGSACYAIYVRWQAFWASTLLYVMLQRELSAIMGSLPISMTTSSADNLGKKDLLIYLAQLRELAKRSTGGVQTSWTLAFTYYYDLAVLHIKASKAMYICSLWALCLDLSWSSTVSRKIFPPFQDSNPSVSKIGLCGLQRGNSVSFWALRHVAFRQCTDLINGVFKHMRQQIDTHFHGEN